MKHRVVPNTISKRFRRKLRRSKDPYMLWLRCKRPAVYYRLTRLWQWQLYDRICSIDPSTTPVFSIARRTNLDDWRLDEPQANARH